MTYEGTLPNLTFFSSLVVRENSSADLSVQAHGNERGSLAEHRGGNLTERHRFGSAARGDATDQSDLDLLVAFNSPKSLLDIVQMERELSESIGHKVDLLTEGSISPHIRDRVHSEMQVLYDRRS